MFCPKCGVENLNTSKFCKKCGKPLPDPSRIRQTAPAGSPRPAGLIGQVLDGKYRIDGKLGSGGMGDVYRATRLLIGDTVAIKILHAHLARDAQAAERFRREAVAATQLRHRNIVALYDVGISAAHNVPFILMELAEGFSLRQIISQYRVLPLDFVVTATAQVCAALDEAHRLGIVHRDIKPENIIANQTTNGWQVKVLDFGIAKLYNQTEIGLTQDGSAMGTPQYMSPEQCMGEQLDGRSDVYSVGILIYEMLAGTVPFKSPAASAIAVHQVQTPPPLLRTYNENVAPQIEAVVMRALEKRREARPQTAQQLSQELIKAATFAFKAGLANVSATPIAAPDVKREFDAELISSGSERSEAGGALSSAASESEDLEAPGASGTEDKEPQKITPVALASDDAASAPVPEPATEMPATDSITVRDEEPKKRKPKKKSDPATDTVTEPPVEARKEEMALVFEDVEHLLDELLPDEHRAFEEQPGPVGKPTVELENIAPIGKPEDSLPVPKGQTQTAVAQEPQPTAAAAPVQAVYAEEAQSSTEATTKGFAKYVIIGGIGLAVIVLIGAAFFGYYFLGGQMTNPPNATNSANPATDPNKPPAGMGYVPGGEFTMGTDDKNADEFSRPGHKVTVKAFFMDLTEVTNEEYKKFVDAAGFKPPPQWKNGTYPEGNAKFPVTGVDWDAAVAYAKWAGKRLPTEEEWEFAARGTDGRNYPWGNEWKSELANVKGRIGGVTEVGKSPGKSPFGMVDMIGNVWEWTSSDIKAYPNGKMIPTQSIEPKMIRGGFWGSSEDSKVTTTYRVSYGARNAKDGYPNMGFRCVKDIQ